MSKYQDSYFTIIIEFVSINRITIRRNHLRIVRSCPLSTNQTILATSGVYCLSVTPVDIVNKRVIRTEKSFGTMSTSFFKHQEKDQPSTNLTNLKTLY